ncbi:hypothetical protein FRC04_010320 [Tulasnella sp. 424]|nr:hypothetical protein FRC04_010320 [Tulasnella sp. 424]KAG8978739.1 hypothetical protein FRC05_010013 [Tulasnella sp. 425]
MQDSSLLNPAASAEGSSDAAASQININTILPLELLINIFNILYQDINDSLPFPFPYNNALQHFCRHPLLDLMLVHRGWYNLVQTTPSYWTDVNIGVTDSIAGGCSGVGRDGIHSVGMGEVKELQERLKKSGSLPLHLTVAPGFIPDFGIVLRVLEEHAGRLENLNILSNTSMKASSTYDISSEYLVQLLKLPLPLLKRLQMDDLIITHSTPEMDPTLRIDLYAPNLQQLSSHTHFVIPQTPSHLTLLSISSLDLDSIRPSFNGSRMELPRLLELRMANCEPGPILSALLTPALQVLIFQPDYAPTQVPTELPEYSHLRDLQWFDTGPEPTFELVFRRCPNITRYANYVVGQETEARADTLVDEATIFKRTGGIDSIKRPRLEEVLIDYASCASLSALVDAVPTIRRIRVLRDPIAPPHRLDLDMEREKESLVELRRKVDIVFRLDPWTNMST